jgi:hypothetical protein
MTESNVWNRISEVVTQLLDLLVDSVFLLLWAIVNWLLLYLLDYLHPSGTIVIVRWLAQGIFAGFTLAIIALHLIHDLKGSAAGHSAFKAVWEKFGDLAKHLLSLTLCSTLLFGWAAINWAFHFLFELLPPASQLIESSETVAQFFVGIATLWKVTKPMYRELVIIYRRLFP